MPRPTPPQIPAALNVLSALTINRPNGKIMTELHRTAIIGMILLVSLPTLPGAMLAKPATDRAAKLQAAVEKQAAIVRKQLTDEQNLLIRAPFVIAGNLSEEALRNWHDQTIAPAAEALQRQFFTTAPSAPITIWLFPAAETYAAESLRLFGDQNVSVYGYYKPDQRTLVMNIGTGGGTLIHELTHALAAFDFPGQPDWFNEGLASLFEQSRYLGTGEKRKLVGLVNWRLPKLQAAIQAGELQTLAELMTMRDFRGKQLGLNYAQARYFCQYLQERGVLEEFYRTFRENRFQDPHGILSARKVLGAKAWKTLDADFQAWVMKLKR
jgi:hypothetical protein